MKFELNLVLHTLILLILVKAALQRCGQAIGRAVVCIIDPSIELIQSFDYDLCTHYEFDGLKIDCKDTVCKFTPTEELDKFLRKTLRKFPQELGIFFGINEHRKEFLIGHKERSQNTINELVEFMEKKGFSFAATSGANKFLQSKEDEENYLIFLKELSEKLHSRGFLFGHEISIIPNNTLITNFNLTAVSELVDWFYIRPRDLRIDGYMKPFTPVAKQHGRFQGSFEYWLEEVLKLVHVECLLVEIGPRVERHRAVETDVVPGPGSLSTIIDTGRLDVSAVCYEQIWGGGCQEFWDDDSNTPWAVCNNDYYTYDNARSLKLKTEFLIQHNISGIIIFAEDITAENVCENGDPLEVIRAVQGIRQN